MFAVAIAMGAQTPKNVTYVFTEDLSLQLLSLGCSGNCRLQSYFPDATDMNNSATVDGVHPVVPINVKTSTYFGVVWCEKMLIFAKL